MPVSQKSVGQNAFHVHVCLPNICWRNVIWPNGFLPKDVAPVGLLQGFKNKNMEMTGSKGCNQKPLLQNSMSKCTIPNPNWGT